MFSGLKSYNTIWKVGREERIKVNNIVETHSSQRVRFSVPTGAVLLHKCTTGRSSGFECVLPPTLQRSSDGGGHLSFSS